MLQEWRNTFNKDLAFVLRRCPWYGHEHCNNCSNWIFKMIMMTLICNAQPPDHTFLLWLHPFRPAWIFSWSLIVTSFTTSSFIIVTPLATYRKWTRKQTLTCVPLVIGCTECNVKKPHSTSAMFHYNRGTTLTCSVLKLCSVSSAQYCIKIIETLLKTEWGSMMQSHQYSQTCAYG